MKGFECKRELIYPREDITWRLVDEALPRLALFVSQGYRRVVRYARQASPMAIPKPVNDGVVRAALGRAQPYVTVFVLQPDVVALSVTRDTGFRSFLFQVKKAAWNQFVLLLPGIDHRDSYYAEKVPVFR